MRSGIKSKIKLPKNVLKAKLPKLFSKFRPEDRVEKLHESYLLFGTIIAILAFVIIIGVILHFAGRTVDGYDILKSIMSSVLALLFSLIILDRIRARSDGKRKRREERRKILRHNKIIQPVIDLYIVRKNMVITPNEKSVRKFKIDAKFTVKDMKDMFGPSELIADAGKSKAEVYAYYQEKLNDKFINLVEDVDFSVYSEICDAAMKYVNATSYGSSALDAVIGYKTATAGTKSMKSIVINMMRDEPDDRKFIDAPPALKNVYLLHQMINDQEEALGKYLRAIQELFEEENEEKGKVIDPDIDYE